MLRSSLQQDYAERFVVKREYVWALKFDPTQPRDKAGRFTKGTSTVEMCEAGEPGLCFANVNRWNARYGAKTDRVVHGKVTNAEGKTFDHAWIERANDTVVDPTTGVVLSKEKYYALLKAQPEASYDSTTAIRNQIRARHHGPWTPQDLGLKFDEAKHPRDEKGRWAWASTRAKATIRQYTQGNARYMNELLRVTAKRARGEEVTGRFTKGPYVTAVPDKVAVGLLDEHMQKNPFPEDTTLTRTVSNFVLKGLEVGDIYQDDGYVSTTADEWRLQQIRADIGISMESYQTKMTVLAPKGLGHINVNKEIGTDHEYAHQNEVILPRGLRFQVVSKGPNEMTVRVVQ